MNRCPVCNKKVNPNKAYAKVNYKGEQYFVCCPLCQREFEKSPEGFLRKKSRPQGKQ